MERLEAEDEADWWRRAASAAASMSTSLRERGTFSVFRERFSSSRPFRLSERPKRISERELEKGQETLGPDVPASFIGCHLKDASVVHIPHPIPQKAPPSRFSQTRKFLDERRFPTTNTSAALRSSPPPGRGRTEPLVLLRTHQKAILRGK